VRIEGFHYPPVLEFDAFLSPEAKAPEAARDWVVKDIANEYVDIKRHSSHLFIW
jgi:hypothetical protein